MEMKTIFRPKESGYNIHTVEEWYSPQLLNVPHFWST